MAVINPPDTNLIANSYHLVLLKADGLMLIAKIYLSKRAHTAIERPSHKRMNRLAIMEA
jgi:hypothetical protein